MTVDGSSRSSAAPVTVPPKGTALRSQAADARSVGEARPLTSGRAHVKQHFKPRRDGGDQPKGSSSRVGPPSPGGFWKVNHLEHETKEPTNGSAVEVASGGLGSARTSREDTHAAGGARRGRTEIGGPAVARLTASAGVPSSHRRRHATPLTG